MSRCRTWGLVLLLCATNGLASAQENAHVTVSSEDLQWGPAPAKLPPGAQIATIVGDPSQPGEHYVFRAKLPDGYSVPPHWHPMEENVTVIQGVLALGFGERVDGDAMREWPMGAFVTLPRKRPHYNRMIGETVLQFHGVGPYDIVYVNPQDDPTRDSDGD